MYNIYLIIVRTVSIANFVRNHQNVFRTSLLLRSPRLLSTPAVEMLYTLVMSVEAGSMFPKVWHEALDFLSLGQIPTHAPLFLPVHKRCSIQAPGQPVDRSHFLHPALLAVVISVGYRFIYIYIY